AVSRDGRYLLAALNQADQAAIVDLRTGDARAVDVGAYPYGAAIGPDSTTGYVTNEYDGTVSVLDLASGRVATTIHGLGVARGDPAVCPRHPARPGAAQPPPRRPAPREGAPAEDPSVPGERAGRLRARRPRAHRRLHHRRRSHPRRRAPALARRQGPRLGA